MQVELRLEAIEAPVGQYKADLVYDRVGPEFALSRTLVQERRRGELTRAELAERMERTQSVFARLEDDRFQPFPRTLGMIIRTAATMFRISFDPAELALESSHAAPSTAMFVSPDEVLV